MFKTSKSESVQASRPKSRRVRGYQIQKMPIGAYLSAMDSLQSFPGKAMEAVFPGMGAEEIFAVLKGIDGDMLGQLLFRALAVVPEELMRLLAQLTGIDYDQLVADEAVGLDGLVEIVDAWMEVNGLENFMTAARGLLQKVQGAATGSKN